jgi:hypothetical protein
MDTEPINFEGAPTVALFQREMERLIGSLKPGRNVTDFQVWAQEIKTIHGHEPYGRLRRAVNLLLTQSEEIPPPSLFGMFMREAARQLEAERRLDVGLLPLDETRREKEERERYSEIYNRVGPGTEPFEWGLCAGIAKARKRKRLLDADPTIDTTTAFRSSKEKEDFGPGLDEPTEAEVRDVYDERRRAGVPIGRNPTATSQYASLHGGGWTSVGATIRSRGWDKDPTKFVRDAGGFKSSRELLEERRAEGRLEPRMEEYLLEKIREEEGDGPA